MSYPVTIKNTSDLVSGQFVDVIVCRERALLAPRTERTFQIESAADMVIEVGEDVAEITYPEGKPELAKAKPRAATVEAQKAAEDAEFARIAAESKADNKAAMDKRSGK